MKTKIAIALATGALFAATVLPAGAFARVVVKPRPAPVKNTVKVTQINESLVLTGVLSVGLTGGNKITGSTGKEVDPSITTGKGTSDVTVKVGGSSNSATVDPCGCATVTPTPTPTVTETVGTCCHNSATVGSSNSLDVTQVNKSAIVTVVVSAAGSGGNTIKGSTGGDTSITTGDASSTVNITVTGSTNALNSAPNK